MSDSGPVSRAEQTERTKDTIVDAVVDLIESHGRFTIAEVSDRSGISPSTIYRHSPDPAHAVLPAVHRVASLLKRWLAGTFHDGQSETYLDFYLDEYTFRFNRRNSRSRGLSVLPALPTSSQHRPTTHQLTQSGPW